MVHIDYLDEQVVVCRKAAGLLSEGEGDQALPTLLARTLAERGETDTRLFAVHRLDKETEGLMVYARTSAAAARLSAAIAEGRLEKEYLAVLCGVPEQSEGELCDLLYYDRQRSKTYVVDRERRGVKEARLRYRVLRTDGVHTLVRVRLLTGRTHQIRAQFASRSLPLRGDRRYGAPKGEGGLALFACRLCFPHPTTGERMAFTCEKEDCFGIK